MNEKEKKKSKVSFERQKPLALSVNSSLWPFVSHCRLEARVIAWVMKPVRPESWKDLLALTPENVSKYVPVYVFEVRNLFFFMYPEVTDFCPKAVTDNLDLWKHNDSFLCKCMLYACSIKYLQKCRHEKMYILFLWNSWLWVFFKNYPDSWEKEFYFLIFRNQLDCLICIYLAKLAVVPRIIIGVSYE